MYVLDNSVLSIFAKVDSLDLLFRLLGEPLWISPNVYREFERGIAAGYAVLKPILALIESGRLCILELTQEETARLAFMSHPEKGESDSLICCQSRGLGFVTYDERGYRLGQRMGVTCLHFETLLRRLWIEEILTWDEAHHLILTIEQRAGMVIRNKPAVLSKR